MTDKALHKLLRRSLVDPIAVKVKDWLGVQGIALFRRYKRWTGTVSPVFGIKNNRPGPHIVHFREGMAGRNFLRRLPECADWADEDFDKRWVGIVERALEIAQVHQKSKY